MAEKFWLQRDAPPFAVRTKGNPSLIAPSATARPTVNCKAIAEIAAPREAKIGARTRARDAFPANRPSRQRHRMTTILHRCRPDHRLGENLFRIGVGPTLRHVRGRTDVDLVSARSRYWPVLPELVTRVPGLREFATWNLLLILRRCS